MLNGWRDSAQMCSIVWGLVKRTSNQIFTEFPARQISRRPHPAQTAKKTTFQIVCSCTDAKWIAEGAEQPYKQERVIFLIYSIIARLLEPTPVCLIQAANIEDYMGGHYDILLYLKENLSSIELCKNVYISVVQSHSYAESKRMEKVPCTPALNVGTVHFFSFKPNQKVPSVKVNLAG